MQGPGAGEELRARGRRGSSCAAKPVPPLSDDEGPGFALLVRWLRHPGVLHLACTELFRITWGPWAPEEDRQVGQDMLGDLRDC